MRNLKKSSSLEEVLLLLQRQAKDQPLSIGEILQLLSVKGRALVLIFLSIPFCQPLQLPGLSIPFGLAIAFVGLRMAFGKRVWLPKRVLSKTIATHVLQKIIGKVLFVVKKMKRWIHPRWHWMCHSSSMQITNGCVIFILGIFLALPLPIPLSNLAAAWSIFLIALGVVEDDGVLVFLGYVACLLTMLFFAAIAFSIMKPLHNSDVWKK